MTNEELLASNRRLTAALKWISEYACSCEMDEDKPLMCAACQALGSLVAEAEFKRRAAG